MIAAVCVCRQQLTDKLLIASLHSDTTTFSQLPIHKYTRAGADPGGFVGFDEPPSEIKNFFGSNSCREGAEFGELNRLE